MAMKNNDPEKMVRKIIDIAIQTQQLTSDVLKTTLKDFKYSEKTGKMSFTDLAKKAYGKLESVEISDDNIGDFKFYAAKHNIDYALKRDSSDPPVYHVFFATDKFENFQNAFNEYAGFVKNKARSQTVSVSREQLHSVAQKVSERTAKDKSRVRARENQQTR